MEFCFFDRVNRYRSGNGGGFDSRGIQRSGLARLGQPTSKETSLSQSDLVKWGKTKVRGWADEKKKDQDAIRSWIVFRMILKKIVAR